MNIFHKVIVLYRYIVSERWLIKFFVDKMNSAIKEFFSQTKSVCIPSIFNGNNF